MKTVCLIAGILLILLAVATGIHTYFTTDFYYVEPMTIFGMYVVYGLIFLAGLSLILIYQGKLKFPRIQFLENGNPKQYIVIGASILSVAMVLYPPKQRMWNGRVNKEHYDWIFSRSYGGGSDVVNIPMLSLQLVVVLGIALFLLYAFRQSND